MVFLQRHQEIFVRCPVKSGHSRGISPNRKSNTQQSPPLHSHRAWKGPQMLMTCLLGEDTHRTK